MSQPLPPPGYYPDPAGSGYDRWWDGAAWTQQLAAAGPPPPPSGDAVARPAGAVSAVAVLPTRPGLDAGDPSPGARAPRGSRRVPAVAAGAAVTVLLVGGGAYLLTSGSSKAGAPRAVAPSPAAAATAPASTSASTSTSTSSGSLKQKLASISIVASDLPGYRVVHDESSAGDSSDEAAAKSLDRCMHGLGGGRTTEGADSPSFESDADRYSSHVSLTPATIFTDRDLAAFRSPRALGCITTSFRTGFAASDLGADGVTVADVHADRLVPPPQQGFAFRVTVTLLRGGGQLIVYEDFFGFASGRAEVLLLGASVGQPPDGQREAQLLANLRLRARLAHLPG